MALEASLDKSRITTWESSDDQSVRGSWVPGTPPPPKRVVYGDWIEMEAGKYYAIEIILGEVPGKYFYGNLHIQEKDATYAKDADGQPILPLFRMQVNLPDPRRPIRPVAKEGPVFSARSPAGSAAGGGVAP